jgi:hypothetical protein
MVTGYMGISRFGWREKAISRSLCVWMIVVWVYKLLNQLHSLE